jgi:tape measure domain-containing protein
VAKDVTLLIKLNDQASGKLSKITNSTKRLEKAANGAQNSIRRTNKGIRDTGKAADKASKGVNNLGKAIRGLAAGFGVFQAGKFVIFKTAELERQTKSLEVLTGSLGNARTIIKELQQFGAVTPFTSGELIETAKRLKAFGFQTEEVVDVTKRLADVAGATGADLGGIATAFGQIQAKGRLQGEELLQLQERGVSLQDELQKMYGLTADEFRKALEGGRISADAVNLALQNITDTGGKYANGAIAQSETLAGKFSTLQDNIQRLAEQLGKVLAPVLKGVLNLANEALAGINRVLTSQTSRTLSIGRAALLTPGGTLGDLENLTRDVLTIPVGTLGTEDAIQGLFTELQALDAQQKAVARTINTTRGATDKEIDAFERLGAAIFKVQKQLGQRQLAVRALATKDGEITIPELLQGRGGSKGGGTEETGLTGMAKALADAASTSVFGNIQDQLDAQEAAGKAIADALNEADRNAEKLGRTSDKVKTAFDGIAQTIEQGITGAIMGAIDGSKSLGESLSGILRQLAGQFISAGVGSFGGGGLLGALFPKRANGGTVQGGRSYMVGERGPELFTPGRTGSIAPNSAIGGDMKVVVNVDASGTEVQGNQGNADQLGRLIGQAVQAELIKQKRPGGLLTR